MACIAQSLCSLTHDAMTKTTPDSDSLHRNKLKTYFVMDFLPMLVTCQLALLLSGLGHRGEVLWRRRGEPLVLRPLELLQQRRSLAQHLLRRRLLNRRSRVRLLFGLLRLKVDNNNNSSSNING